MLGRVLALLARERVREELGLRVVRKRKEGADLRKAAAVALLYWEWLRGVEWVDGKLRRRTG